MRVANREIGVPEIHFANREIGVPGIHFGNREIGVPGKGAAPGPSRSGGNETRLYGILVDVVDGLKEMRLVADEAVPVFAMPDRVAGRFAETALMIANLAGGEFFPGGDDLGDGPAVGWFEEDVDVIRHDNPSDEVVSQAIKRQQGLLHHGGNSWLTQNAGAMTGVDPCVDALAAFDLALGGGKSFYFSVEAEEDGLGEAVGKVKGDVLGDLGAFKMGEIPAAVPPGSAILRNGRFSIAGREICSASNANREIGVPGRRFSVGHGNTRKS